MPILKHIALIPFLLIFSMLLSVENTNDFQQAAFVIEEGSELKLSGSSNVNKFTCACECYDEEKLHNFKMKSTKDGELIKFENNVLKLRAGGMDCGHRGMNQDMYQMLNVEEHPYITIELLNAKTTSEKSLHDNQDWVLVIAETALTIAGVCQQFKMDVRAKKLSDQQYRFIGTKKLFMDDFQLHPPSPMLGLIKVHNEFQIQLDLIVRLEI